MRTWDWPLGLFPRVFGVWIDWNFLAYWDSHYSNNSTYTFPLAYLF